MISLHFVWHFTSCCYSCGEFDQQCSERMFIRFVSKTQVHWGCEPNIALRHPIQLLRSRVYFNFTHIWHPRVFSRQHAFKNYQKPRFNRCSRARTWPNMPEVFRKRDELTFFCNYANQVHWLYSEILVIREWESDLQRRWEKTSTMANGNQSKKHDSKNRQRLRYSSWRSSLLRENFVLPERCQLRNLWCKLDFFNHHINCCTLPRFHRHWHLLLQEP